MVTEDFWNLRSIQHQQESELSYAVASWTPYPPLYKVVVGLSLFLSTKKKNAFIEQSMEVARGTMTAAVSATQA